MTSASQPGDGPALRLVRWTVTSGSNTQSRGAVVLRAAEHRWEATAEGNGPIDALFNAVDRAIADIVAGHPRLLTYRIHALAEGPDAEGEVRVEVAPPAEAGGDRAAGRFTGVARSTNIVAASIEAYIRALEAMLHEAPWAGAAEAAGDRRGRPRPDRGAERVELDEAAGGIDTTDWFNR
jgi:2-isopropylmalate synthase